MTLVNVKVKKALNPVALDNRTMRLPKFDTHFRENSYQTPQQERAYALCTQRRRAIDAGAHVGYFSKNMATIFEHTDSFEPDDANRACFVENVPMKRCTLHEAALGEHIVKARVVIDEITNSGAKHIELDPNGDVQVVPLDMFGFADVDLIKIDTQGFELPILHGASMTIERSHPVLCVEMPKRTGDPGIVDFLAGLGYHCVAKFTVDWIFVHE